MGTGVDDQGPQQQTPPDHDAQVVAAVLAVLAVGAALDATTRGLVKVTGLPLEAVHGALEAVGYTGGPLVRATTLHTQARQDSAIWQTRRANAMFRAAFIWNAAKRLATRQSSVDTERRRWQLHKKAQARRTAVAITVQTAKAQYGPLLGWYAVHDTLCSPECRAADGRNFEVADPPMIGFPGAVHPHCRCSPGPPHPGAKMVNDSLTVRRSDDASGFYN